MLDFVGFCRLIGEIKFFEENIKSKVDFQLRSHWPKIRNHPIKLIYNLKTQMLLHKKITRTIFLENFKDKLIDNQFQFSGDLGSFIFNNGVFFVAIKCFMFCLSFRIILSSASP